MAHEIAKLLLEHADTFLARKEAVKVAIGLGMPFNEIEDYLDWLDSVRPGPPVQDPPGNEDSRDSGSPPAS